MKLKIGEKLSLPIDAITQTFLIVGKRGSGKSNTAARLVEQFHRARLPFVVLDPTDTWWGLKAGRDGEKGLDVYVFGGRKADLPLNPGDGALIAEVLCEHRASMVLSCKHLSGRERSGFMVAFATTLFQKWGGGPVHVVLEEAHELAPQMGGRGGGNEDNEAAMLGAFKRLWKLGRASGIGGSAITQRPASLSKDITTQSEILIAHRTIGPQDVKAIGEWVKYHGEKLDILAELPSLPTGEAFVWAPEFPEGDALGLVRTTVLLRETYDSASTPKVGERRIEPKELAPVDLEKLRAKMSATIAKAKADDPRELRAQIAALKADLARKPSPAANPQPAREKVKTVEKPVLKAGQLDRLVKLYEKVFTEADRHRTAMALFWQQQSEEAKALLGVLQLVVEGPPPAAPAPRPTLVALPAPRPPRHERTSGLPLAERAAGIVPSNNGDGPGKMTRAMLTVLAQHPAGLQKRQILILADYSSNGATSAAFAELVREGWARSAGAGRLEITEKGITVLGPYTPLPVGDAFRDYLLSSDSKLSGMERTMLGVICDSYPNDITKGAVLEGAKYSSNGATSAAFAKLVALGYAVSTGPARLKAGPELFDQ